MAKSSTGNDVVTKRPLNQPRTERGQHNVKKPAPASPRGKYAHIWTLQSISQNSGGRAGTPSLALAGHRRPSANTTQRTFRTRPRRRTAWQERRHRESATSASSLRFVFPAEPQESYAACSGSIRAMLVRQLAADHAARVLVGLNRGADAPMGRPSCGSIPGEDSTWRRESDTA
jgi:hypothetical protein